MQAAALQPEDVERYWPLLEPFISRVCKFGGEYVPSTILTKLLSGEAQAWVAFTGPKVEAVCVTEIFDKDIYRACNIWLCAGSYSDEARDCLLREIEDWARRIGCERVQLVGRRGWEKKMPAYRRTRVILEKRL